MDALSKTASSGDFGKQQGVQALRAALVALPLVLPLVSGPSVSAWQLMVSWVCAAALMLGSATSMPSKWLLSWFAAAAIVVLLGRSPLLGASLWLSAFLSIAVICVMACYGAGIASEGPLAPHALAVGLLSAALVSVVLGLLQYYGAAGALAFWTTEPAIGQAYGNLRQRNQFASLLNFGVVAGLWMHFRSTSSARGWWRGCILFLTLGLAASTSRTGLLELILIVGFTAFMAYRERTAHKQRQGGKIFKLPSPAFLLALIPLYFAAAWLLPQLASGAAESMLGRLREGAPVGHSRLILWRNVLTLIAEHPWTGWGWGELGYAHYSTQYPDLRFVEILDNAHNLPLHLAVELGIPASALICGGFAWLVIRARPWSERNPERLMAWGLLGVIVLHSLVEYPLWYGPFQLVFGVCLGMLWPAVSGRPLPRSMRAWVSVALIVVIGYAGWDYTRISQIYLPRQERLPAYQDNTLEKLQSSWLFANQVQFAELTLTSVTPVNARRVHELATRLIHFSPEPRVIVKLIESAELLGFDGEAKLQADRFRIAFPADYAAWLAEEQAIAP